jgi:hypothetical protein
MGDLGVEIKKRAFETASILCLNIYLLQYLYEEQKNITDDS